MHLLSNRQRHFIFALLWGLAVGTALLAVKYHLPAASRWLVAILLSYAMGSGVAYSVCLLRCSHERPLLRLAIVLSAIVAFAFIVSGYPLSACRECALAFRVSFTGLTTSLSLVIILVYATNLGIPAMLFVYNCVRLRSFHIALAKSFASEENQRNRWRTSPCRYWLGVVAMSTMVGMYFVLLRFAMGT